MFRCGMYLCSPLEHELKRGEYEFRHGEFNLNHHPQPFVGPVECLHLIRNKKHQNSVLPHKNTRIPSCRTKTSGESSGNCF